MTDNIMLLQSGIKVIVRRLIWVLVIIFNLSCFQTVAGTGKATQDIADADLTKASSVVIPLVAPKEYFQAYERLKQKPNAADYKCEFGVAPFTESLNFRSKYEGSDSSRSILNKEAEEAYLAATKTIRKQEKLLVKISDHYLQDHKLKAKECLIKLLSEWASKDALLHQDVNHIGQSIRKWFLASAGSAYLKVTLGDTSKTKDQELILNWFSKLAAEVQKYYSGRPLKKVNNHDYWAAWSVMVSSVNLQSRPLFEWALSKYQEASSQIGANGYLPNEIRRNTRALGYHNYAIEPLVMLMIFAEANNYPASELNNGAIHRLADRVVRGITEPKLFETMTGYPQEKTDLTSTWSLAWIEPYIARYPLPASSVLNLPALRPLSNTRLGGDMTALFQVKLSSSVKK